MYKRAFMLFVLCVVCAVVPAAAQTDSSAALESIAAAYDALHALQGVQVAATIEFDYAYSAGGGADYQSVFSRTRALGVQNAQADMQFRLERIERLNDTDFFDDALHVEVIRVDGETYLDIDAPPPFDSNFFTPIQPGWERYDTLLQDQLYEGEDTLGSIALTDFADFALIPNLPIEPDRVIAASEGGRGRLGNLEMRTFSIEFEPLRYFIDQGVIGADDPTAYPDFIAQASFQAQAQFWIGVEDGYIHRIEVRERVVLPYASAGGEFGADFPGYDSTISEHSIVEFSAHDQPVTIAPPRSFARESAPIQPEDDPLQTVLSAYQALQAVEGYTFESIIDVTSTFTDTAEDRRETSATRTRAIGTTDVDGDTEAVVMVSGGTTLDDLAPPLTYEIIRVDDQVYLNLRDIPDDYANLFDPLPEPGWQRLDVLRAEQLDNGESISIGSFTLDSYANLGEPLALPFSDDTITRVEILPEIDTLDGSDTRVYALELEAIAYRMRLGDITLEQLLSDADLIAVSDLVVNALVWIREDDGAIVQIQVFTGTRIPYSMLERDDLPPFDIEIEARYTVRLTGFNPETDITAPDIE